MRFCRRPCSGGFVRPGWAAPKNTGGGPTTSHRWLALRRSSVSPVSQSPPTRGRPVSHTRGHPVDDRFFSRGNSSSSWACVLPPHGDIFYRDTHMTALCSCLDALQIATVYVGLEVLEVVSRYGAQVVVVEEVMARPVGRGSGVRPFIAGIGKRV